MIVHVLHSSTVEPSLDGVADLLSHPNVDVGQVVDALEGIVDELIASGQTATYEFTEVKLFEGGTQQFGLISLTENMHQSS